MALTPGCKNKPSEDASRPVVLMLDWKPEPEFGGFYQAKLAGGFSSRGVTIDIQNANGEGVEPWQQVAQGTTDFATTSADLLLEARNKKADVVALFAVYQTSPQGIMVHKARGFKNIDDVFTHPGTLGAEDNTWLKFLLAKFPNPAVTVTANPAGIGVFMAKADYSQQCFVTSEPLEVKRQGGDPQTFLVADAGFNPYVTVLITSGKTLREKPELVNKVVAACREGWRAYLDDPSAANKEMGSLNREMDARTFAECAQLQKPFIETDETRKNGLGTMTGERWKTLIQQLADLKVIHNTMPAEECFVNVK